MLTRISIWFATILIAVAIFGGCATTGLPSNATITQKLQADAMVMNTIATDVRVKCGPQFAATAPIVVAILSVAANPYDALNDVMQAISVIPLLAQDYKAATCVVTTIRDDIHTFFGPAPAPAPASTPAAKPAAKAENDLHNAAEMGNRVIDLLNQGATVTVAANADGGVEMSAYTP